MSVSAYISEFKERVDKLIQKNIQNATDYPYPIDELNGIRSSDPDSAIAKMFDESGELSNGLNNPTLAGAAAEQNKDLYNRLRKGSRYMKRLANNERLAKLDPEVELNQLYTRFISELNRAKALGGDINIDEILGSSKDDFEDIANSIGTDSEFSSIAALQAAFNEMRGDKGDGTSESKEETEADPLNDEDIIDDILEEEDPLNEGESTETDETVESEVTESTPELEKELQPTPDEERDVIDEDRGFVDIEQVSPINPDVYAGDHDINKDGTVTDAEYSESVMSNITENVTNEVTNINDQIS